MYDRLRINERPEDIFIEENGEKFMLLVIQIIFETAISSIYIKSANAFF